MYMSPGSQAIFWALLCPMPGLADGFLQKERTCLYPIAVKAVGSQARADHHPREKECILPGKGFHCVTSGDRKRPVWSKKGEKGRSILC